MKAASIYKIDSKTTFEVSSKHKQPDVITNLCDEATI